MANTENLIPFRPVRLTESKLKTISPEKGHVYFTTDTKKIYMTGSDNELILMGGSSNIYYASKTFDIVDDIIFSNDNIEGDDFPNINDLIINTGTKSSNGFYKVIDIISDTELLAIQLPVGGGGTGSGSDDAASGTLTIDYDTPSNDTILYSNPYSIKFNIAAKYNSGDLVPNSGVATWYRNNTVIAEKVPVYNGSNIFNVSNFLGVGNNTFKVRVSYNTGGLADSVATRTWNINAVNLSLDWKVDYTNPDSYYINSDKFILKWTPKGKIDCYTHIAFDDIWQDPIYISAANTDYVQSKEFSSLSYGAHKVSMYLTATIGEHTYSTDIISNELTFILNGNGPILTVPYYDFTVTQFDTLSIPFMIYDPTANEASVSFYAHDQLITSDSYSRGLQYWNYTVNDPGDIKLKIEHNETVYWEKEFSVNVLDLPISEVGDYKFSLKAKNISTNSELKALEKNGIVKFSDNFDWINGGLIQEKILDDKGKIIEQNNVICVKNGSTLTIDYEPFKNNIVNNGFEFKVIFKAVNCYKYDAVVMQCLDNSNTSFTIDAQTAKFIFNKQEIKTQYCENSYIELEAEVWAGNQEPDNLIMLWINGVPAAVKVNAANEIKQTRPQKIIIGSSDCDVYIYLMKIYDRQLNIQEHMDNFIMDAPNGLEIRNRYQRNDIINDQGFVDYEKLLKNNPEINIFTYDIPRMTRNKEDAVQAYSYAHYHTSATEPDYTSEKPTFKVQGTSSAAYGVAAYNLDTDFSPNGFKDNKGNQLSGWSMRENSIPIDFACTKVNVASCENANNMINQEWYHRFQPYWDGHRRKNSKARDCMEFIPGVLFIKDRNNNKFSDKIKYEDSNIFFDTDGYMSESSELRPYLQYAICNMGNSKKNTAVFHDKTNPKACCVEITDNQTPEQWMTNADIDTNIFDINNPPYDFRYVDKNNEATMRQAFINFVKWMATSNPAAATGDPLPQEATYGNYKFKGFNPPGFDDSTASGITLKSDDLVISDYAGTYTHDTYEYRMAKMLNECEDHLVMDSVVYHYLFIERHTMVDNVAKNTFWSTEDGIHWDLTKNYDNDTADGNDNSGNLVFSYGLETTDFKAGTDTPVFNAYNSVWLKFIDGLYSARQFLYKKLATKEAWSATDYLTEFTKNQKIIPERCWIEDYIRKYIRPRRLGLDNNTFLARLEGGLKDLQREQYETYHKDYIDTKYQNHGTVQYDMRLNTAQELDTNYIVPISYYIDCYAYGLIGGKVFHERVKRGEKYNIPIGLLFQNASDATCYFYLPDKIQTIENIAGLQPTYVNAAPCQKLRVFQMGSNEEGYRNPNIKSDGVNFSGNAMLEKLEVQNLGMRDEAYIAINKLVLSKAKSLQTLDMSGSNFIGLVCADGALLNSLKLNGVSSLELKNLIFLTAENVQYDEDIYDKLSELIIHNCSGIDTYSLIMNNKTPEQDFKFDLQGINWQITNNSLVNGELQQIDILEKLLKSINASSEKLTGTIYIDQECTVDKFNIYKKYKNKFLELDIQYNLDKVKFVGEAYTITFMQNDDSDTILFEVLTDGHIANNILTSASGPAGKDIGIPQKPSTEQYEYKWGYNVGINNPAWTDGETVYTHGEMLAQIPNKSTVYTPIFVEEEKKYTIALRDENGNNIAVELNKNNQIIVYDSSGNLKTELDINANGELLLPYRSTITVASYFYRPHKDDYMRHAFKGWVSSEDHALNPLNPTYIYLNDYEIVANLVLYQSFKEEDARTTASDERFFEYSSIDFKFNSAYSKDTIKYMAIKLKDEYAGGVLQGPITLPNSINGVTCTAIGDFRNSYGITAIYTLQDNSYECVCDYAFANVQNIAQDSPLLIEEPTLKLVRLGDKMKYIGNHAFYNLISLENIDIQENNESLLYIGNSVFARYYNYSVNMQVKIEELPRNLEFLGAQAFRYGGENIRITRLPHKITVLRNNTFYLCPNVYIKVLGSNNPNDPGASQLMQLDSSCLEKCGTNLMNTEGGLGDELIINTSIRTFATNCFKEYGYIKNSDNSISFLVKSITFGHKEEDIDLQGIFGLERSLVDYGVSITFGVGG